MNLDSIFAVASAPFASLLAIAALLRKPRSLANVSFAVGMALLATEVILFELSADALLAEESLRWQKLRLIVASFLPGVWLFFSLVFSRGNHREFLRRWREALAAALLIPPGLAVGFSSALVVRANSIAGEEGWLLALGRAGTAVNLCLLLGAILILMNLERTLWASVGTARWRIKYMVLGLGVVFVVRIYTASQALLFSSLRLGNFDLRAGALLIGCVLIARSLLRQDLFNVAIYPSQKILHGSLTALLAGVYLLIVGVFAQVVALLGGDAAFPIQALFILVAVVGLAVLLLSERVRQRLKQFISRHFKRPVHDYRQVLTSFSERTASRKNERELCDAVVKWIAETFDTLSATIWLVEAPKQQLRFGASTSLVAARNRPSDTAGFDAGPVLQALQEPRGPFEMDERRAPWMEILRRFNPEFFPEAGTRICVPVQRRQQLLGLMVLGDRVNGEPFSVEDLDLLQCVSNQLAGHLLSLQLAHRLLQAKELEAFQTMSAFFVHDLKNTAASLSLMLQNLDTHFADPAFREDALRAVTKSVHHLNDLIQRLGFLRQELKMNPAPADLSQVIETALQNLPAPEHVSFTRSLEPVPRLLLDADQIRKVVVNLVLNAFDAVGRPGEVRVQTSQRDGWAVVSVTDNGCGISPEFMAQSLFRPFQSTKKRGLGIGMFHSKMIVDAHGGRFEVDSQLGQGTTIRLLLPLAGPAANTP